MEGFIADIGERARVVKKRRSPRKFVVATTCLLLLAIAAILFEDSTSGASNAPVARGWQYRTLLLPQVTMESASTVGNVVATYHFKWNDTYSLSSLNWSTIDRNRTDQRYFIGLGAKLWVTQADIVSDFPVEITQGDGTSLDYRFNYTTDRETPHIYLTGERTFWKWENTPSVIYDYRVKGSCSIEDAWRNGSWSPAEGIAVKYSPEGTLVLGQCDFSVQLYVYDVLVPELDSVLPASGVLALVIVVLGRRRKSTHSEVRSDAAIDG